jgi:ATP-dependent Clp protease protease subunit
MHPAGGGAHGYAPDVEIAARELLRMQARLHEILARHTGQPREQIALDFQRDRFMSASEAVEYGLIDQVLKTNDKKLQLLSGVAAGQPEEKGNE